MKVIADREMMAAIDKGMIVEAIHRERVARDTADWARLAASYTPDSRIEVSWFRGSGQEFAKRSEEQYKAGLQGWHKPGITIVDLRGNKALARLNCDITLISPVTVGHVEVEFTGTTQLYYRMVKADGHWLVHHMTCVYIKDMVTPCFPDQVMRIDHDRMSLYRRSYRYLCYMMQEGGHAVSDDLPGVDRPDMIRNLVAAGEQWLLS